MTLHFVFLSVHIFAFNWVLVWHTNVTLNTKSTGLAHECGTSLLLP